MNTETVQYDGDVFRIVKDAGLYRVLGYGAEPPPKRSWQELMETNINDPIVYPFPEKYLPCFEELKNSIWPWTVGADGRELALYHGFDITAEVPAHGCWLFLDYPQTERDNVRRALGELNKKLEEQLWREMEQENKIWQWLKRVFDELEYSDFGPSALFVFLLEELGHADLARQAEDYFRAVIAPNLDSYFKADALAEFDCQIERFRKEARLQ